MFFTNSVMSLFSILRSIRNVNYHHSSYHSWQEKCGTINIQHNYRNYCSFIRSFVPIQLIPNNSLSWAIKRYRYVDIKYNDSSVISCRSQYGANRMDMSTTMDLIQDSNESLRPCIAITAPCMAFVTIQLSNLTWWTASVRAMVLVLNETCFIYLGNDNCWFEILRAFVGIIFDANTYGSISRKK